MARERITLPGTQTTAHWELVDARRAEELLARNTHNRKKQKSREDKYARDMEHKHWLPGVAVVVMSSSDYVSNGQHVLGAIVQSRSAQWLLIVENSPDIAQHVMDALTPRRFNQQLYLKGVAYPNELAAAVKNLWVYKEIGALNDAPISVGPTHEDLNELLSHAPGLASHCESSKRLMPGIPASLWGVFSYLAHIQVEDEDIAETVAAFKRKAETGAFDAANPGDPSIHTLRSSLIEGHIKHRPLVPFVRALFLVKAWNAWRSGVNLRALRYRPSDVVPPIDGCIVVPKRGSGSSPPPRTPWT